MSLAHQDPSPEVTEHGLLVAYGRFAQQIGLTRTFEQVPFDMKTVEHSPADKIAELFCHILAGGMHVNELAKSAHPLVNDQAVARAWGQETFASASGVSALLHSVGVKTVEALRLAIREVSEPYRRRILRDLSPAWIVVDMDLTGLVVSDQATTYEGADFGYMGECNDIARGYQFARVQLVGRQDVLVLGGFLYSGHTVPTNCLAQLVALVEAELGKPRRRVECLEARLAQTENQLTAVEAEITKEIARRNGRPRRQEKLTVKRDRLRAQVKELEERRDRMVAENAANGNPRRIILRVDGGFGDAPLLAWLYEQGYDFVARAHSHWVADKLRGEEGLKWEKVSKNGFIAESKRTSFGQCPYAMRLFASKQWWGDKRPERWSALIVNPELAVEKWPVRRVGVFYNERQIMEAGIKEGKSIFASRHLPTRHQAGIELYQELVLLAQNLIRWFRRQFLGNSVLAAAGVKELVRIGANSRALLVMHQRATLLTFAADSPWRGITLSLSKQIGYQLWFSFLDDCQLIKASP